MFDTLIKFSGPIEGLINKGISMGVVALFSSGVIDPTKFSPESVTAAIVFLLSVAWSAFTRTQAAKIQAINSADNGVKVVPAGIQAPIVDAPLK